VGRIRGRNDHRVGCGKDGIELVGLMQGTLA
jgi:hypothetical protein